MGTKAEDEEKKKARIAALEAEAARRRAQAGGGASEAAPRRAAVSRRAVQPPRRCTPRRRRRWIIRGRRCAGRSSPSASERRAAMLKEKEEREKTLAAEDEDPAMAPLNDVPSPRRRARRRGGVRVAPARIVGNALNNPGEPKYRRVRLANPKIAAAVLETDGGLVLLECSGFRLVFEDDGGEGDPRVMVLDADADPAPPSAAFRRLARPRGGGGKVSSQAAPAAAAPVRRTRPPAAGRNARAFTPAEVCAAAVTDLGDEYFQRTPEEIQAEMARKRQRERRFAC